MLAGEKPLQWVFGWRSRVHWPDSARLLERKEKKEEKMENGK